MSKNSGGSFKTETPQESRPPIRRCAVYARVSTINRGDDQLTALEAQIQSCKDYIKSQRGMGWELIEPIYVDNGLSGGNMNRPALRQLINDMEAGKIDAVVIQRLDRLSRNLRDMADMMPLFTIPKISLISINQSLDTETPLGRIEVVFLSKILHSCSSTELRQVSVMDCAATIEKLQIFPHRFLVLGIFTAQHAKSIAELMMQSLVIIALDIYAEDSYKNITAR